MEVHKQIFFEEMGALLKGKRQERKISVDDVMQELKFSKETISAMENAIIEHLPSAVYAKGFYRAYASFLKIDESIVDAFISTAFVEEVIPEKQPSSLNIPMKQDKEESSTTFASYTKQPDYISKKLNAYKIAIIVIGIIALGYFVYSRYFSGEKPTVAQEIASLDTPLLMENVPAQVASIEKDVVLQEKQKVEEVKKEALKVEEVKKESPKKENGKPVIAVSQKEVPPAPMKSNTPVTLPELAEEYPIPDTGTTIGEVKPAKQEMAPSPRGTLRIVAKSEVWIEAKYDGKTIDFTLAEGQTRNISFSGIATVKVGDISAVEMFFKRKAYKNLGEKGKVRTYTFSTDE